MTYTHASLIPLIGGETIGTEQAFGSRPEWLASYEPFWANDRHLVNYYDNEVPYYVLDKGAVPHSKVDIIASTCPCSGLSQMSHGFGDDNVANLWLPKTAEYVLSELKPKVYFGESAPGFAGKIGDTFREQLYKIGRDNGYAMSVYRTRSLLHGVPQVRERSFYFFWEGDRTPLLNYYNRPRVKIEDCILGALGNTQREPINPKTPSKDDPYYRYILEEIHGGISHAEFCKIVEPSRARGKDVLTYIEKKGVDYDTVSAWMASNNYPREVPKCAYRKEKLARGKNIMRRGTVIPRDYIGAFVGHYPTSLTHPVEDRYINYREAMTIMGLPDNFQLLDPKKSSNHPSQNVPVQTARDMATEIKAVLDGERPYIDSTYTFQYNYTQTHEARGAKPGATLDNFL